MSPSRMRFTPEPMTPRARHPCVCVLRRRLDAPSDKAKKRPFLGRPDASRTETPRSVFPPQKREKTGIPTAGDKTSPDAPYGSHICAHGNARMRHRIHGIHGIPWISWISWIFSGKRAFARICEVRGAWIFCGFLVAAWISRGRMHAQDGAGVDKSPAPKISPGISPSGMSKKTSIFKDLRKISPISPISPGCRGYFVMRLHTLIFIRKR